MVVVQESVHFMEQAPIESGRTGSPGSICNCGKSPGVGAADTAQVSAVKLTAANNDLVGMLGY